MLTAPDASYAVAAGQMTQFSPDIVRADPAVQNVTASVWGRARPASMAGRKPEYSIKAVGGTEDQRGRSD